MVEIRRGTISFVCGAATLAVALASGPTWSQPPVARPLPPPASTSAQPPATTPAVTPVVQGQGTTATGSVPRPSASVISADTRAPSEAVLGVPIMPNAQYIGSYDAGGAAQRFYLFGTIQSFVDVVAYYRTVLKQKGELVFEVPPTHMFEVGRFKEADVAFPPGVTVKDYVLHGAFGLANPQSGALPAVFATVIQIVPPPQLPPVPVR